MKLMVANRSEIACRIFQGAKELGLKTVAIYAPGDEGARHVTVADEVYPVPSYLDAEAIVKVAKANGVQFIHPGYGFLSERPYFARAVTDAGIDFLGPLAETMESMGGKIAAKEIAEQIGVPTVPWAKLDFAKASESEIKAAATKVGYPLLIKASAGGGGKGMRRVNQFSELKDAAESAGREALNSFGDGTLFFERFIESPKHIEVQVFGDGKGGGIHLYERECSLQRRHQKVIEEAPAATLHDTTRQGLYESAMKLVEHTRYRSAGTIEFLVNEQGEYFFIEMNTRLQVEHPVTEAITGIDLVHEQIKLAHEKDRYVLPTLMPARGHAMEVRVYAEDPSQGFIPCTGTVQHLIWPSGPGIRVDRGIEVGQEMGISFDSMCAKIITHAPNREIARQRMIFALSETVISGLGTNIEYLNAILHHPKFKEGKASTKFLDQEFSEFNPIPQSSMLELLSEFEASGGTGSAVAGSAGKAASGSGGSAAGSNQAQNSSAMWSHFQVDLKGSKT
jgi:acetyl/propionyl-CoA carboxylase alpha subunit